MRSFGIVTFLTMLALGVLWLMPETKFVVSRSKNPEYRTEMAKTNIRDVTPENALPGPRITGEQVTRLPDVVPSFPPKIPKKPKILHKTTVLAAGKFKIGDSIIEIAAIVPLKLDETCKTLARELWPCGRFARTALRGLVRGRRIQCDAEIIGEIPVVTHCKIANRNIGEWLVRQGWAKTKGELFSEQLKSAKENKRGMWRTHRP